MTRRLFALLVHLTQEHRNCFDQLAQLVLSAGCDERFDRETIGSDDERPPIVEASGRRTGLIERRRGNHAAHGYGSLRSGDRFFDLGLTNLQGGEGRAIVPHAADDVNRPVAPTPSDTPRAPAAASARGRADRRKRNRSDGSTPPRPATRRSTFSEKSAQSLRG